MARRFIFEAHATSEDNELGIASGWNDCGLSARGMAEARQLGDRHATEDFAAIVSSDLARARMTATAAFPDRAATLLIDSALRECNYGSLSAAPREAVHGDRGRYLTQPYPGGESWQQAIGRAQAAIQSLALLPKDGDILIVGHLATHWGIKHLAENTPLDILVHLDEPWQPGWSYEVS
jgi:2,3-bisphosphoglycerate-dependent phosphoglycerate mutase